MRIAVDAMGGDRGPSAAVGGAALALTSDPGLELTLVGDAAQLNPQVKRLPAEISGRITIVAASGIVPADIHPARALRNGEGTSMQRALALSARGETAATVSAGNTGALMALSRTLFGMLPGLERPALMSGFPGDAGPVWVLDLGANVDVDARRLLEFALIGAAAVSVLNGSPPRVALLNIGVEPNKGPDAVRAAAVLIGDSGLDYVGFIEAHDIFAGRADVIVCDGFAGNVLLKCAEGVADYVFRRLDKSLGRGLGRFFARTRIDALRRSLDPAAHNGAPLLGINGIVIKSHGGAGQDAFANAIGLAAIEVRRGLVPELERQLLAGK